MGDQSIIKSLEGEAEVTQIQPREKVPALHLWSHWNNLTKLWEFSTMES